MLAPFYSATVVYFYSALDRQKIGGRQYEWQIHSTGSTQGRSRARGGRFSPGRGPAILSYGQSEQPIKIGVIDPLNGTYAAEGESESPCLEQSEMPSALPNRSGEAALTLPLPGSGFEFAKRPKPLGGNGPVSGHCNKGNYESRNAGRINWRRFCHLANLGWVNVKAGDLRKTLSA
jgi:hypothetical protein